ncbi:hypothetical protein CCB80_04945 [Armatimonadetes bacterium Uphvl-Ar1]|nr:hypothetical protein CCB80_04945 [Armatimonadetes bacterium Uphvl-Ar1]
MEITPSARLIITGLLGGLLLIAYIALANRFQKVGIRMSTCSPSQSLINRYALRNFTLVVIMVLFLVCCAFAVYESRQLVRSVNVGFFSQYRQQD